MDDWWASLTQTLTLTDVWGQSVGGFFQPETELRRSWNRMSRRGSVICAGWCGYESSWFLSTGSNRPYIKPCAAPSSHHRHWQTAYWGYRRSGSACCRHGREICRRWRARTPTAWPLRQLEVLPVAPGGWPRSLWVASTVGDHRTACRSTYSTTIELGCGLPPWTRVRVGWPPFTHHS
jgi:hypothetical protein